MVKSRKAISSDLNAIVALLHDDPLGSSRENIDDMQPYEQAFAEIDADQNQHLIVLELADEIIGTCHLTIMPSLTFGGQTRLNIEAARIKENHRSKGYGKQMLDYAEKFARENGAGMIQLAMNKTRDKTIEFYEKSDYIPSHIGLKKYL